MRRWQPPAVPGEGGLWLAGRAGRATGWTGRHLRHVAGVVRQGRNPAARVYESIGSESVSYTHLTLPTIYSV